MSVAIITGSVGLVGAEAALSFSDLGLDLVGVDNDMRKYAFGEDHFTAPSQALRGGALTRPHHATAQLHGFRACLMHCTETWTPYAVFVHKGKQVPDVNHSGDLAKAFHAFRLAPQCAAVHAIGGGRTDHCSVLETIYLCQEIAGVELDWTYQHQALVGNHIWRISSLQRIQQDYPEWQQDFTLHDIALPIAEAALAPTPQ